MYDVFAELCTINGSASRAIADDGFLGLDALAVNTLQPILRVIASENPLLAVGQTVVWNALTFHVADLRPIFPDKLETNVILERQ